MRFCNWGCKSDGEREREEERRGIERTRARGREHTSVRECPSVIECANESVRERDIESVHVHVHACEREYACETVRAFARHFLCSVSFFFFFLTPLAPSFHFSLSLAFALSLCLSLARNRTLSVHSRYFPLSTSIHFSLPSSLPPFIHFPRTNCSLSLSLCLPPSFGGKPERESKREREREREKGCV